MSNHEAEALGLIDDVLAKAVDVRDAAQGLVDIYESLPVDAPTAVRWGRASTALSGAQSALDQLDHLHTVLSSGR